jgi:malonyl-CoA/methylmalonyl-CoA synthetase
MAVPTIYRYLIEHYENNGLEEQASDVKRKLKGFRLMVSGSASLPQMTMQRWKEISGHTLLERFGMTEVGMALTNPYADKEKRLPGHVGYPFPGVKSTLLDLDTNELHNNVGQEGELLL